MARRGPAAPLAPPSDSISALLAKPEIKAQIGLALPRHMTPERLLRIALTEVRRNPKLAECSQASLLAAVFQCAQLGLEPGGSLGHAWLVPFGREVQFQIGYRGMIDLARRSGQIHSIEAHAVYEGDHFDCVLGLESDLKHLPDWSNPNRCDAGKLTFVYAVARLKDGGTQFEVMSRAEVEAVRKRSRSGSSGPWQTDFAAMALKTVVRRLFKWLPISIEMSRAVGLDEAAEIGIKQETDLDAYLEVPTETTTVTVVEEEPSTSAAFTPLTEKQVGLLTNAASMRLSQEGQEAFLSELGVSTLSELPAERFDEVMRMLGDGSNVAAWNGKPVAA